KRQEPLRKSAVRTTEDLLFGVLGTARRARFVRKSTRRIPRAGGAVLRLGARRDRQQQKAYDQIPMAETAARTGIDRKSRRSHTKDCTNRGSGSKHLRGRRKAETNTIPRRSCRGKASPRGTGGAAARTRTRAFDARSCPA